jgi:hypothetical protein
MTDKAIATRLEFRFIFSVLSKGCCPQAHTEHVLGTLHGDDLFQSISIV